MKKYTKVYLEYFNYDINSFVPCEVCQSRATDIHHIIARSQNKSLENEISNLMALCRECHQKYGDIKEYKEFLTKVHLEMYT
jgi:hypothetical protein